MKKILLFLFLILFGSLINPKPVLAQNQIISSSKILRVSPVIINPALNPGEKEVVEIKVENLLNIPLGVRINFENLDSSDEETGITFKTPQPNSPLFSWTKIQEKELIIPERSVKSVVITIEVPEKTKTGGYYGLIFLAPFYTKPIDTLSPTVVGRIGALLLVNVGKPQNLPVDQKIKIVSFDFNGVYDHKKTEAEIRVKNLSSFHFPAKPRLEISPLIGQKQVLELEEKRILPGKIRKWRQNLNLPMGVYKAKIVVSLIGGDQITEEKLFTVLPLKKLILGLTLLLFLALIMAGRKRLKKAMVILLKNK